MKAAVCIKRVPDTTTRVRVGRDGRSIDPEGVSYIISPYDEYAIEEALRLKDAAGIEELVAISLDPEGNDSIVRKALAMGLDRGVLLSGGTWLGGFSAARALADELRAGGYGLVFFGKQAVDDDSGQIPQMVAHLLGWPCVSVVTRLDWKEGRLRLHRQIEGAEEVYELAPPAVLGITKTQHEPRFATLKGIMSAKKKPLEKKSVEIAEPDIEVLSMEPPPARPAGRIVGKGVEAVPELIRLLREEAKVI